MPIANFIDPKTLELVSIEEAVAHFEETGLSPGEVIQAIIDDRDDARRKWLHLSPSILNPENNCRREIAIQRFLPFNLDPLSMWSAYEGTAWHRAFNLIGENVSGWHKELALPGPADVDHPKVRKVESEGQTFYELEVFPGIWLSGVADRVREDFKVITDFKSTNYPWTRTKDAPPMDFAESQIRSYQIQVNLYGRMVELLKGTTIEELWVWRIYRGSRNRNFTFRKLPIPKVSPELLESKIREHAETLDGFLRATHAAEPGPERDAVVNGIPMDGKDKRMYNDQKCSLYCGARDVCYKLAGHTVF